MSSVDLGSNFNFAILVLIMLLLVSQMEVGSTSTTVGSCTEPKLAGSIAQEPSHVSQQFNLTPDMTIMLFYQVAWYHMRATYWQDQEFSWCFYWLRCVKKTVKRKQAQDPAQSDMFPVPLGQLLVPQPLRWSRWKGDCTQLWKSQLSGLSQNKALQNIMFVWSAFSLGNGNLISVSQCPVFGTTHFDLPRSGPQWFLLFGPWMKQVPVHSWIWSQEAPFYSWGSSHLYQEQETQI